MTSSMLMLLAILGAALAGFALEWTGPDVVALGVLLALILTGLVPAERAFAGFGSPTVLLLFGLLILTAGMVRTGVVDVVGRRLLRHAGEGAGRLLALILIGAAGLSAVLSNTAATAFFLPVVMGLAMRARISPSRLLMPLAFAATLSSPVTLISTSSNIVVSGLMTGYGLRPIGMFELTPVGLVITAVGIVYMLTVGRRLVPERVRPEELDGGFGLRDYLTEVLVPGDSHLAGRTLEEAALGRDLDLTVLAVVRDGHRHIVPQGRMRLAPGDVLLVQGRRDAVLKVKDTEGLEIKPDVTLQDPAQEEDAGLAEVILMPGSPLAGRTLRGVAFRDRYGLQVLAINRRGAAIRQKLSTIRLRLGDVLLVQGPPGNIRALESDGTLQVLGAVPQERVNTPRARTAVFIFLTALALGSFGVLSLPVAALLGAFAMFVTRTLTPEEAYRAVDWRVLVLIGSLLAVGTAMEQTGLARYVAGLLVGAAQGIHPLWILSAVFALTVLLTQPMSNQVAAVVVLPVAVQAALQLDLNPRTFAVMVAVAASASYLTPLEPSCLMVYGAGRYRFADFLRVGGLLVLVIYAVSILLVPVLWPLHAPR
ncbi:MAG TPA: SLC13 family permease [bacterium]|nr:SLC13 family permease [bacterium]